MMPDSARSVADDMVALKMLPNHLRVGVSQLIKERDRYHEALEHIEREATNTMGCGSIAQIARSALSA